MQINTTVGEMYDIIAGKYNGLFRDPIAIEENIDIFNRLDFAGESVLDIGCGTGIFFDYCQPTNYVGIDPSSNMLAQFQLAYPETPTTSRICNRFEDVMFDRQFDLIVALFGAASYIEPEAWSKVPDLLTPNGRIFAMFYQDDYFPVTYEKAGVVIPHFSVGEYDLTDYRIRLYHDRYLIAEFTDKLIG